MYLKIDSGVSAMTKEEKEHLLHDIKHKHAIVLLFGQLAKEHEADQAIGKRKGAMSDKV